MPMTIAALPRLDRLVTDTPSALTSAGPADNRADGPTRTLFIDRAHPRAAHNARFGAIAAAWDWHLGSDATDDLVDVVDALVVNAIQHAKWPEDWPVVPVTIAKIGPRIVVEVRDPDPTLPEWPTARPMDIAALLDDPDVDPDDLVLIHRQGLVDVAGRALLSAFVESVGKVVRAELIADGGASL